MSKVASTLLHSLTFVTNTNKKIIVRWKILLRLDPALFSLRAFFMSSRKERLNFGVPIRDGGLECRINMTS